MSTLLTDKPLKSNADHTNSSEKFNYFSLTTIKIQTNFVKILNEENLLNFCLVTVFLILLLFFIKPKQKNCGNSNKTIPKLHHQFSFGIPFLDGIYNLYQLKTVGVRILEKWSEKTGPIFLLPLVPVDVYLVGDASVAQKILSSCQPTHLNKTRELYDRIMVEWFRDGLVNLEYDVWSPHRKMLSRCFTYKSLQQYLKIMNKYGKKLANELSSVAIETKACKNAGNSNSFVVQGEQVHEIIYFQVIKIIAQIVIGADDKFSDETLHEWTINYQRCKDLIVERLLNPIISIPPVWYFHPMKKDYDRCIKYVTEFFHKITQVYRKEHKDEMKRNKVKTGNVKNEDLKDDNDVGEKRFRCVIQEMLNCNATDKEIYDEVGTVIGAGHETIIIAIQMLLVLLAVDPDHQVKCRKEIDEFFSKKSASDEYDDEMELTMDDLSEFKYLERCVLESLRLFPPFPLFLRRLDAPIKISDDMELGKGSNIAVAPWVVHRNPEYYSEPEKFDPDRFLPENVKKRHAYANIPFSAGIRNCIGYKVALMEIKVVVMWILRNFEVESNDKLEDVKLNFYITFAPERNYNLMLRKRKIM